MFLLKLLVESYAQCSAPDPAVGAYSALADPLAVFKEAYF